MLQRLSELFFVTCAWACTVFWRPEPAPLLLVAALAVHALACRGQLHTKRSAAERATMRANELLAWWEALPYNEQCNSIVKEELILEVEAVARNATSFNLTPGVYNLQPLHTNHESKP